MMVKRTRLTLAGALAALLIAAGLLAGTGPRAGAQEDGAAPHPAHIHAGSCAEPGEVLFPLTDVALAEGEAVGSDAAVAVETSETEIDAALDEILAGDHAIVVHESAENISTYIACGDIGGVMVGNALPVGLDPLNDSGYRGVALLADGDGGVTVSIYLTAGEGAATHDADQDEGAADEEEAAADDEGAAEAAGPAEVEIADFAFGPDTLEIPAGTTVIWTNTDSAPHTVSQTGGGFDSGKLDEGQTFRFTFDEPGTYEYFCQFHPNMTGTIIVS